MKTSLRCPKCDGRKIWVLERYRIPGESAEGRQLAVVPHQGSPDRGLFGSMRLEPKGHFDLFACAACGYSELWASGLADLRPDEARGIRLIDGGVPEKVPFR